VDESALTDTDCDPPETSMPGFLIAAIARPPLAVLLGCLGSRLAAQRSDEATSPPYSGAQRQHCCSARAAPPRRHGQRTVRPRRQGATKRCAARPDPHAPRCRWIAVVGPSFNGATNCVVQTVEREDSDKPHSRQIQKTEWVDAVAHRLRTRRRDGISPGSATCGAVPSAAMTRAL
jgi:hypothetical protein